MMKRNILFLVFFSLLTVCLSAQSVSKEEALQSGLNFYSNQSKSFGIAKSDLIVKNYSEVKTENNEVAVHIFNFENGGFILMSGDKNSTPILAYSYEGCVDLNNMSPATAAWLENYQKEIEYLKNNNVVDIENKLNWERMSANAFDHSGSKNYTGKAPFVTTQWGQDYPYNNYCPNVPPNYNGGIGKCVTGCVATAMAQIMKYYNYPNKGIGTGSYYYDVLNTVNFTEGTYNWANMPNKTVDFNDQAEIDAVAKIMYHAGVSVSINYGPNSTGLEYSNTDNIRAAFTSNFGYRGGITLKKRAEIPTNEWLQMIMNELDLNRPVCYLGFSAQGGHAFVCDGYQNDGIGHTFFHFNFGWEGASDGYYNLYRTSNYIGDNTMGFSIEQMAVIGVAPSGSMGGNFPFCTGKVEIPFSEGTFDDGSATNLYKKDTDCEWLLTTETFTIDYDSLSIAFNYIDLGTGDTLKIYNGKDASAQLIKTLTKKDNYNTISSSEVLFVRVHKSNPNMLLKFTTDNVDERNGWEVSYETIKIIIADITDNVLSNLKMYPNPATDYICLSGLIGKETIQIVDITGRELFTGNSIEHIDISNFQAGIYFIRVSLDGSNKIMKLLKE